VADTAAVQCTDHGTEGLSQTAVSEWHSRFKVSPQMSVEDDERSGRPCTSKMTENVEKI
jgi:hypothetical protein